VHLYQKYQFEKVKKLMQTCIEQNPQDTVAQIYIQRCQNFLKVNQEQNWEKIAKVAEWSPDLSVHNQTIDEQHQELFVRMKGLIMSIGSGQTEEEVGDMIQFLESYSLIHLQMEEEYMRQYQYPGYMAHKAKHAQFMENLKKIKQHYLKKGGSLYLTLRIQDEIVEWFMHHIRKMDQQLALFLKDKI
jgi:hemerythrin